MIRPKHEYLKTTVCCAIFGQAMVFENLADALACRDFMMNSKKCCPSILVHQEKILLQDGFMEAGKLGECKTGFGELPVSHVMEKRKEFRQFLKDYVQASERLEKNQQEIL